MSSYRHDGRIPRPRDLVPQCRDTTPSAPTTALPSFGNASVSHPPRPQLARPVNPPPPTTTVRSSSFSAVEESRPALVTSRLPGSSPVNHARQSLLPRPASQSLPLKSHRHPTYPPPTGRSMQLPSGHAMSNPHQLQNDRNQAPANARPKNVLRRKAPTIGQHTENDGSRIETTSIRPEKLSVIIPSNPAGHVRTTTPQTPSHYVELGRQPPSQNIPGVSAAPKMAEFQAGQGPKELASLRTTVNTQNLPPPTPTFPTTGSPSTRYSGSPGIWSRTSTPTSLSSCSPGIVHPVKIGRRLRQLNSSQTMLPVFSPAVQSSPQIDRADFNVRKSPNIAKETGSSLLLPKAEHGGPFQTMGSAKASSTAREPPRQNLPTGPDLPKRVNSDTDVQKQIDETESCVFDPPKVTRARTADGIVNSAQSPPRPSREGTHRLELEPSPIIKSNLPPQSVTNHRRRGSTENVPTLRRPHPTPIQSAATSVDSFQSRGSSRIPPRTTTSPVLLKKPRQTLSKGEYQKQEAKSPAKPKRFGLFPRKSRPDLAPDQAKPTRKGPAAGTGHEGYGRYGQPGRRTSVSSNGSGSRSISTVGSGTKPGPSKGSGRNKSDLELDEFLLDRLEPVVISGGGVDGAALTRMQSAESASGRSTASSSMGEHSKMPHSTGYSTSSMATSLGVVDKPTGPESGLLKTSRNAPPKPVSGKRGADPGDGQAPKSRTLARNVHEKLSPRTAKSNVSLPFLDSQNSSVTALPQATSAIHPPCRAGDVASNQKAQPQKGRGKRWNFFLRDRGNERKNSNSEAYHSPAPQLPAKISPVAVNRPIAHYAFVGADSDPLEDILQKVEDSPPTEDEEERIRPLLEVPAELNIVRKMHESILLPSPPQMQAEFSRGGPSSPKVFFNKNYSPASPEMSRENKRRSRLESIGRIPQVISRRDREHKPALKSFSRPFSITDTPSLAAPVGVQQHNHRMPNRTALNMNTSAAASNPTKMGYDPTQPFGDPAQRSALDFLAGPYSNNEFLTFSRNGSQDSSSSDSGALSAITAVVPNSSTELTTDEVWGEYDDLIDHFSPETSLSAGPSHAGSDEKFEMATMASKTLQSELNDSTDKRAPPMVAGHPDGAFNRVSSGSSGDDFHLRRSKIITALQSPLPPSSQPSYSDIIAAYQRDSGENVDMKNIDHGPPPKQTVQRQSSLVIPPFMATSQDFESSRQRNTILFDIAERDREGPTVQTNLRSGSLMTSRWLSFGRVLFSPAHNHAKSREQERILVIDGLGNDDWSFYCSLNYPKAEVYSLVVGPTKTASTSQAAWQPPSNHHIIHHANFERALPFPKGFFAVTALRFPSGCSGNAQNNIISECKRVLRPGGYLEMSILDLDMVNMGSRTRKAVRRLKERTYLADDNISLKPASDSIQRTLGRHGFDNLRRCMVQVPVAGMIVRSSGSSSSSNPSIYHASAKSPSLSGPKPSKPTKPPHPDEPALSLGDLLSDPSPSATNDESIRKIVAKVGRWWYTRCYEIPVLPDGDVALSIWADKKVLRECQKTGTGFRLLIAYAQKPSEKRRTASV